MPRSTFLSSPCLLLFILALCTCKNVVAQTSPPNKPGIAENSPLAELATKDNFVTPASFLNAKKKTVPAPVGDDPIPSILTGSSKRQSAEKPGPPTQKEQIDPLNIPSRPIGSPKNLKTLPGNSPFVQPTQSPISTGKRGTGSQKPFGTAVPSSGSQFETTQGKTTIDSPSAKDSKSTATTRPSENPRIAKNSVQNAPGSGNRLSRKSPSKPEFFTDNQLSPLLKVTAVGPRTVSVNKTGKFEVKVQNLGQVDANDLVVGIAIPSWVEVIGKPTPAAGEAVVKNLGETQGIVWTVSYLPPGRDSIVTLNLEPKENRAFNLKTEWTTAPVSGESKVMVTQPNLETRISGPEEVKYGAKAVYTITIENTGNGMAEKVAISLSESLGGDSATIGLIPSGATKQFEVELIAGKAGPMKLEALVKGEAGIESEIKKDITVRRAKLIAKASGPKFKYAGSAITYSISVENQGDATAKNISAAALLPIHAVYISGLNQITENDGRKIGWKVPEIPAGSKRDYIITCLINEAGAARMEFGVRSEGGLTSGNVVNTKVEALADLKLEVVDPRGPQAVGRDVTYELHIKNRGTKSAQNVLVSGEFSDFIDPISGTGAKSQLDQGGVITFDPIQQIKVGETVVLKVIAKATKPGTHTFRAIVNCQEQDIRKISEGTTKFFGDSSNLNPDKAAQLEPESERFNPPAQNLPSAFELPVPNPTPSNSKS